VSSQAGPGDAEAGRGDAEASAADASLTASAPPMRPEVAIGAAFAGGLLLAMVLRRVRS
jgi:hypothetical protein